jgi:hypothetical protein
VRVARLQRWTYQEAVSQPLAWLYLIAADHALEAEEAKTRRDAGAPAPAGSDAGAGRRTQTIEYRLKPRKKE